MTIKTDGKYLLCPCCGETYLHHGAIDIFTRHEDAEETLHTSVTGFHTTTALVKSDTVDNPSGRRYGLRIGFWCEVCGEESALTLAQHKGNTHIEWETNNGTNS